MPTGHRKALDECGIPIKSSTTVLSSTTIVAHGIELDSVGLQARLLVKSQPGKATFTKFSTLTKNDLEAITVPRGYAKLCM
jgi:hypothetical protein